MITPLLALALIAPADTPIEPINEAIVELFIDSPEGESVCDSIAQTSNLVDVLGGIGDTDLSEVFNWAVSYWQDSAEEGFGEAAAMTLEAEDTFREWAYSCAGRTDPGLP